MQSPEICQKLSIFQPNSSVSEKETEEKNIFSQLVSLGQEVVKVASFVDFHQIYYYDFLDLQTCQLLSSVKKSHEEFNLELACLNSRPNFKKITQQLLCLENSKKEYIKTLKSIPDNLAKPTSDLKELSQKSKDEQSPSQAELSDKKTELSNIETEIKNVTSVKNNLKKTLRDEEKILRNLKHNLKITQEICEKEKNPNYKNHSRLWINLQTYSANPLSHKTTNHIIRFNSIESKIKYFQDEIKFLHCQIKIENTTIDQINLDIEANTQRLFVLNRKKDQINNLFRQKQSKNKEKHKTSFDLSIDKKLQLVKKITGIDQKIAKLKDQQTKFASKQSELKVEIEKSELSIKELHNYPDKQITNFIGSLDGIAKSLQKFNQESLAQTEYDIFSYADKYSQVYQENPSILAFFKSIKKSIPGSPYGKARHLTSLNGLSERINHVEQINQSIETLIFSLLPLAYHYEKQLPKFNFKYYEEKLRNNPNYLKDGDIVKKYISLMFLCENLFSLFSHNCNYISYKLENCKKHHLYTDEIKKFKIFPTGLKAEIMAAFMFAKSSLKIKKNNLYTINSPEKYEGNLIDFLLCLNKQESQKQVKNIDFEKNIIPIQVTTIRREQASYQEKKFNCWNNGVIIIPIDSWNISLRHFFNPDFDASNYLTQKLLVPIEQEKDDLEKYFRFLSQKPNGNNELRRIRKTKFIHDLAILQIKDLLDNQSVSS